MAAYRRGRYALILRHKGEELPKEVFSEDGSDLEGLLADFAQKNPDWQTDKPEDNSGAEIRFIGPE